MNSAYDYTLATLDGKGQIPLRNFREKDILMVNVASECGNTPQYSQLQELHDQFGDRVEVIGIPSNDFGAQEPGSAQEIIQFCQRNYGVSFKLSEKIHVKGDDAHPLYQYLFESTGKSVNWNFGKYIIKKNESTIQYFDASTSVFDEEIMKVLDLNS